MLLLDVGLPPRNAAEYAESAVQPGAGPSPRLDDPAWFTRTRAAFLG
ncbi:hypothetical protein HDA32_000100 [Spinactinospora alkalitolerans]|uniref:Uncharacterized protein n=1 Tax=Spinactinospora alkalitolerans TaxID=687207 RepID=A0A852TSM9_9ACTN|nr:hypothetical protein [Spinactinospora alkalitolerans]NYE44980.1 hypothetical protein [Spinactinospora alkalitolerans]